MAMNGFQLFCVEPVTGASSTDTFNVQLLGIKLRSLAKKPLCAMLVAGMRWPSRTPARCLYVSLSLCLSPSLRS